VVGGRKMQEGRVAVMRGPMLFCLNPELQQRSAAPQELRLDPKSIEGPVPDSTVCPDGTACRVRAWTPGVPCTESADVELVLTEFADPGGTATYFLVPDLSAAVEDELIRAEPRK
jgi:hypothetical protein